MAHISKPTRKIVFVIRNFVHYEWIFEMTLKFESHNSLRKMAKFTTEQKKFSVKSFARNTSATQVRREFLLANEIRGRKRDQYHLKDFSRVNDHFEKNGSI